MATEDVKDIWGFIGKPGAGKAAGIGFLGEELWRPHASLVQRFWRWARRGPFPYPILEFSDPINECLRILRKEKCRPNQQLFSTTNRDAFGQDLFNEVLYLRAVEVQSRHVFIGGVRRPLDIQKLRTFPRFHLVFVTADPEVRWQRIRQRNDRPGDADLTWEDFQKQDSAETERAILELGAQADFTIDNSSNGFEGLRKQVAAIVAAVGLA